jgi:hypothetical protein
MKRLTVIVGFIVLVNTVMPTSQGWMVSVATVFTQEQYTKGVCNMRDDVIVAIQRSLFFVTHD